MQDENSSTAITAPLLEQKADTRGWIFRLTPEIPQFPDIASPTVTNTPNKLSSRSFSRSTDDLTSGLLSSPSNSLLGFPSHSFSLPIDPENEVEEDKTPSYKTEPCHPTSLTKKQSSAVVDHTAWTVVNANDPAVTVWRVADQVVPKQFGEKAFFTQLVSEHPPVGAFAIGGIGLCALLGLYLQDLEDKHQQYANNPMLAVYFLKEAILKAQADSFPADRTEKVLNKLCHKINIYLQQLRELNPAFKEKYSEFTFKYSLTKENGFQFYLLAQERVTKQLPINKIRRGIRKIYNFFEHALNDLFTAAGLFWLAWICGTILTNSLDNVTPGIFGIAAFWSLILPLVVVWSRRGRQIFNYIISHYQFQKPAQLSSSESAAPTDEKEANESTPPVITRLLQYKVYPKEKGFLQSAINGIVQFFIGTFFLLPPALIYLKLVNYRFPKNRDKEPSSATQKDIQNVTQSLFILQKYDACQQDLAEEHKKLQQMAAQQPASIPEIPNFPKPDVPSLTLVKKPSIPTTLRKFLLNLVSLVVMFEYITWFLLVAYLYVSSNAQTAQDLMKSAYAYMPLAIAIAVISAAWAVYKTGVWYQEKAADAKQLNTAAPQQAVSLAKIDQFKQHIADLNKKIALFKARNPNLPVEEKFKDLNILDATDIDDFNLKDPEIKRTPADKFFNGVYFITFAFFAVHLLNTLFLGRTFFVTGTSVTTILFQDFLNPLWALIYHVPLAALKGSALSGIILVAILATFSAIYGYARISAALFEKKHNQLKSTAKISPFQEKCLEKQYNTLATYYSFLQKSATAAPAITVHPGDLYTDPESWNHTIKKSWQLNVGYFFSLGSLAVAFVLLACTFSPASLAFLPTPLVFSILAGIMVFSALLWSVYIYKKREILTTHEKYKIAGLILSLMTTCGIILFLLQNPLTVNTYIYPALLCVALIPILVLFTFNFKKSTSNIAQAKTYLAQHEVWITNNLPELKPVTLTHISKERMEQALDMLLLGMNPYNKGQTIDIATWGRSNDPTEELLLDFNALKRIRDRIRQDEFIAITDQQRLREIIHRFKQCQTSATNIHFNQHKKRSTTLQEKIDYACGIFILILAIVGVFLTGALADTPFITLIPVGVIAICLIVKLLADNALAANPEESRTPSLKRKIIATLLWLIITVAAIAAVILPFLFSLDPALQVFLPLLACIAIPISFILLLDNLGVESTTFIEIRKFVSALFSPRRLTKALLVLLQIGAVLSFIAALFAPLALLALPIPTLWLVLWPLLSLLAILVIFQAMKRVFDFNDPNNYRITKKLFRWLAPVLDTVFNYLKLFFAITLAVAIPALAVLTMFHVITVPTIWFVPMICVLPMAFFAIKVLLPDALFSCFIDQNKNPAHVQQRRNQLQKGCTHGVLLGLMALISVYTWQTAALSYLILPLALTGSLILKTLFICFQNNDKPSSSQKADRMISTVPTTKTQGLDFQSVGGALRNNTGAVLTVHYPTFGGSAANNTISQESTTPPISPVVTGSSSSRFLSHLPTGPNQGLAAIIRNNRLNAATPSK
jgi:hypothetical protein